MIIELLCIIIIRYITYFMLSVNWKKRITRISCPFLYLIIDTYFVKITALIYRILKINDFFLLLRLL